MSDGEEGGGGRVVEGWKGVVARGLVDEEVEYMNGGV